MSDTVILPLFSTPTEREWRGFFDVSGTTPTLIRGLLDNLTLPTSATSESRPLLRPIKDLDVIDRRLVLGLHYCAGSNLIAGFIFLLRRDILIGSFFVGIAILSYLVTLLHRVNE